MHTLHLLLGGAGAWISPGLAMESISPQGPDLHKASTVPAHPSRHPLQQLLSWPRLCLWALDGARSPPVPMSLSPWARHGHSILYVLPAAGAEGQGKVRCFVSRRVKSVVPIRVDVLEPPAGLILPLSSHARLSPSAAQSRWVGLQGRS